MGKKAMSGIMLMLLLVGMLALAFNVQLVKAENDRGNNWNNVGLQSLAQPDVDELLAERVGFGRNASGGLGGAVYYVTSLADSGAGSLRAGAESINPLWIVFNVSGTIYLNSLLQVKSDKTFDGRGANVTITGYGFNIKNVSNIIVTNLVFDTAGGDNLDGVRIYDGAHDIWVHHCSFTNWTDGCLDITEASTDVTVSWCRFWNHDKTMLIGADPSHTDDVNIRVTLHHNFFNGTRQRHPWLRFGKVDAYNNYLYNWDLYGMRVTMYGQLLIETNIFEAGSDKDAVIYADSDPASGYVKLVDNLLLNGAEAEENGPEQVFDRSTYYNATIETANSTLKWKIVAGAGAGTPAMTPHPPEASFTYTPSHPSINQTVTFDASASQPGWNGTHSVSIANYTWDFGDGNVTAVDAPMATVTHVYSSAGTFAVNLTVMCEDDPALISEGLTSNSAWKSVNVIPPSTPVASFAVSPPPYYVNKTVVSFDASGSEPGFNGIDDVPIANYTWDFGDGNVTAVDAPMATVTHVYSSAGTFTVNLTVTCEYDPTLIAEGLTANSTWKNITVTVLVTVVRLVVRTLWTNMSAMVGAGASVSNATYTVSDTTNSSGLTAFSLTKGLYNLTVSYSEVTINETTGLNLAQDMTVTVTKDPAPYERIINIEDTISNLQSNITDLQSQISSLQRQARNNLYIGIGGGSIIGLFIGVAAALFLRKKR